MNKSILVFLFLEILGFSKDETLIKEKKISEGKRKFLSKLSERRSYKIEIENLIDYNCICIFNN